MKQRTPKSPAKSAGEASDREEMSFSFSEALLPNLEEAFCWSTPGMTSRIPIPLAPACSSNQHRGCDHRTVDRVPAALRQLRNR